MAAEEEEEKKGLLVSRRLGSRPPAGLIVSPLCPYSIDLEPPPRQKKRKLGPDSPVRPGKDLRTEVMDVWRAFLVSLLLSLNLKEKNGTYFNPPHRSLSLLLQCRLSSRLGLCKGAKAIQKCYLWINKQGLHSHQLQRMAKRIRSTVALESPGKRQEMRTA